MRYFFITQDVNLPCAIKYRDFDINGGRHLFTKEDAGQMKEAVVLYLTGSGYEARWDFLQRPVTMFSERFKKILDAYEPGLVFQDVILIHKENGLQYRYTHVLMEEVEAIGSRTEYNPNGTEKRLVLDGKKIGNHNLFLLKGSQRKDPLISLAVAESILRRNVIGVRLEEVEVE